jgi:23S rRNA (cytosine1962-C5)-methyltransferase
MDRARLILKPKEDLRIRGGHPWIYDNEIARVEGEAASGDEVDVVDARGILVGSALYNTKSKIRGRLYSRKLRPADRAFFVEAIGRALAWRRRFFDPDKQSLRLVFGEADGIPGLIVDSFVGEDGRWLCAQFLSFGMASRKELIVSVLGELVPSTGIVEKDDAPVLKFEGLEPCVCVLAGAAPEGLVIQENGLSFAVDLISGQKTGWFLDQRANRAAAARYARDPEGKGRRVLDAFCNAGGFGLACAAAGAASVVAVDSSAEAVAAVSANAERNGLSGKLTAVAANAFDYLRGMERAHERFGLIVLDPPAFAKNRASIEGAHRGYKDLNLRALKLLETGGILVTCSCSFWFGRERFGSMLSEAAKDAGRRLRIMEERSQDLDHPIVSGYDESRYLKCVIAEVEEL